MIINLNTVDNPRQGFRDETNRMLCGKCHNWLRIGHGMCGDPIIYEITQKHLDLCEGDESITLMKVEQWWKETHSQETQTE